MISKRRGKNNIGTPIHIERYEKKENDFYDEIIKKDSKKDEVGQHEILNTDKIKKKQIKKLKQ